MSTKGKSQKHRKACVFCGASNAKITKEHAWPNWMRCLFPPGPTTVIGTKPTKTPITFYPGPGDMGVKANAVCKACNEGWMNDLEEAVRPLLTPMIQSGASTMLSPEQQMTLARWAVKTAMVFEFTRSVPRFYTCAERNALRAGTLPVGTIIWVARYDGSTYMSTAVGKSAIYEMATSEHTTHQPGSILTLSAGRFVVQVLTVRLPAGVSQLVFPVPQRLKECALLLWPRQAADVSCLWPPATGLNDGNFVGFTNRMATASSADLGPQ